jgi:SAM-dependent methyltransferase
MLPEAMPCKICGYRAKSIGTKSSLVNSNVYGFYECEQCGFFFVGNPWLDYEKIYTEAYYKGMHGDPTVDYFYELDNHRTTIRNYEYRGLLQIARTILKSDSFSWLDYGCGNGGLVKYVDDHSSIDIRGYEEGAIAQYARDKGIRVLNREQLMAYGAAFDFISAVEVIEHHPDPMRFLEEVRLMLKPGGVLFLTTGNAAPFKRRLLSWSYASVPDVHVSFFQPKTLAFALAKAGLVPLDLGYIAGHTQVIKYKVLKTLRIKTTGWFIDTLPWFLISRVVDFAYGVTRHPVGIRKDA